MIILHFLWTFIIKCPKGCSSFFGSPRNECVTRRKSATTKKHRQTNIATPFSSQLITYNASTICRRHYPAAFFRIGRSTIVQVHTTNCNSINTINITAIGTVVKGTTIPSGKGVDSAQAFTTLKLKGQSTPVMRRFCVLFQRRRRRRRKKWKRKCNACLNSCLKLLLSLLLLLFLLLFNIIIIILYYIIFLATFFRVRMRWTLKIFFFIEMDCFNWNDMFLIRNNYFT